MRGMRLLVRRRCRGHEVSVDGGPFSRPLARLYRRLDKLGRS